MLALVLVALALGLDNLAASIGIGLGGIDARTRLRVAVVFGAFETGTPILGVLLGSGLSATLGHAAHWIGAAVLIATGLYGVAQAVRDQAARDQASRDQHNRAGGAAAPKQTRRLVVTGAALSIDNLAVGFALGTLHVRLALAVVVIGAVCVAMSLVGLELGGRLSATLGARGELAGGLVLIGVGIAVASGAL
jgi:manganese efflux pump family protein